MTVRRRQPEIERPGGGLGQEHHAEQGGGAVEEGAVCCGQCGDPQREFSQVQGPGQAVHQGDADQENQRGDQIDHDVMQAGTHARAAGSMQQQPVGGGKHDLEKDEEVEQVAGEEAAIEAHEQELE